MSISDIWSALTGKKPEPQAQAPSQPLMNDVIHVGVAFGLGYFFFWRNKSYSLLVKVLHFFLISVGIRILREKVLHA